MTKDEIRGRIQGILAIDARMKTFASEARIAIGRSRVELAKVAMEVFNEASTPFGTAVELGKIAIDIARSCAAPVNPIGVCVYAACTMSLPAQRGEPEDGEVGCLFCGKPWSLEKAFFVSAQRRTW